MLKSVLAFSAGASLGALLRWGLACLLNAALPPLFLGTLLANLLGGYLMGVALAAFAAGSGIPEESI